MFFVAPELKIVDDDGKVSLSLFCLQFICSLVVMDCQELPHDGKAFGDLYIRGPWSTRAYYKAEKESVDSENWFQTGSHSRLSFALGLSTMCVPYQATSRLLIPTGTCKSRTAPKT